MRAASVSMWYADIPVPFECITDLRTVNWELLEARVEQERQQFERVLEVEGPAALQRVKGTLRHQLDEHYRQFRNRRRRSGELIGRIHPGPENAQLRLLESDLVNSVAGLSRNDAREAQSKVEKLQSRISEQKSAPSARDAEADLQRQLVEAQTELERLMELHPLHEELLALSHEQGRLLKTMRHVEFRLSVLENVFGRFEDHIDISPFSRLQRKTRTSERNWGAEMDERQIENMATKISVHRSKSKTHKMDQTLDAIAYLVLGEGWDIVNPNEHLYATVDRMIEHMLAVPSGDGKKKRNDRVRSRLNKWLTRAGIQPPGTSDDWFRLSCAISETDIPARDWADTFAAVIGQSRA